MNKEFTNKISTDKFSTGKDGTGLDFGGEVRKEFFSKQTLISLTSLGETIKKIRVRLIKEGYVVKGGKIYKK